MIWENNVKLVVMVCPVTGPRSIEESINYWEDLTEPGQTSDIEGVFNIKLLEVTHINQNVIKRKFELTLTGLTLTKQSSGPFEWANTDNMGSTEEESHIIEHLQDCGWEDNTAA